jgi:hypothetical protein
MEIVICLTLILSRALKIHVDNRAFEEKSESLVRLGQQTCTCASKNYDTCAHSKRNELHLSLRQYSAAKTREEIVNLLGKNAFLRFEISSTEVLIFQI